MRKYGILAKTPAVYAVKFRERPLLLVFLSPHGRLLPDGDDVISAWEDAEEPFSRTERHTQYLRWVVTVLMTTLYEANETLSANKKPERRS